jgi:hypothetical protein
MRLAAGRRSTAGAPACASGAPPNPLPAAQSSCTELDPRRAGGFSNGRGMRVINNALGIAPSGQDNPKHRTWTATPLVSSPAATSPGAALTARPKGAGQGPERQNARTEPVQLSCELLQLLPLFLLLFVQIRKALLCAFSACQCWSMDHIVLPRAWTACCPDMLPG